MGFMAGFRRRGGRVDLAAGLVVLFLVAACGSSGSADDTATTTTTTIATTTSTTATALTTTSAVPSVTTASITTVVETTVPTSVTFPPATLPEGTPSPCDINDALVGTTVTSGGDIAFVDDTDTEGYYADLERDGCRVGIFVDTPTYAAWNPEDQAGFEVGATIVATGFLESVPFPFREDEFQLVIALSAPPDVIVPSPVVLPNELPPLLGPPCDLSGYAPRDQVALDGMIAFVDDGAAAGIYGELESGGCRVRVWVERARYDVWPGEAQSLMAVGTAVSIDGILTIVLGEPVVDLSTIAG